MEELKPDDLARNLRILRLLRGFEQRELALKSGVDRSTISRLEHGRQRIRPKTLGKLANALRVTPELLGGPTT